MSEQQLADRPVSRVARTDLTRPSRASGMMRRRPEHSYCDPADPIGHATDTDA